MAARRAFEAMLVGSITFDIPGIETLDIDDRMVPGAEGDPDVPVRVYRPGGRRRRRRRVPGVLMIHGGGFVIGSVEAEHAGAALTAVGTGAVVVSVDYRLAPEHPFPAGLHDCYAALDVPARRGRRAGRRPRAGGPDRGERRGRAGGGDGPAGPRSRRAAGLLPDAADPRARRSAPDRLHADVRGLADVEQAAGRAELAGLSRAALRDRRRAGLRRAGPGGRSLAGCRRPTSRRPRTIRCATRGSPTPSACCRPASRWSCTSSPGTFHGSALVTTAAVSRRAQRESALVLRQALGVDGD